MNEKAKKLRDEKLQTIVERATAAADSAPPDLDAETASLREAWLHLGELIEHDIQPFAGASHVSRVRLRRVFRRHVPLVAGGSNRSRIWLAAVAASLLVTLGAAFALRYRTVAPQKSKVESPPVAQTDGPITHPPAAVTSATAPAPLPPRNQSNTTIAASGNPLQQGEPVKWGDSVDDEIKALGQAAIYVQQNDPSSRLWEIETGLDQLDREVEHGNL